MIVFSCRQCATRFKVPEGLAGKQARCKKCGETLQVPKSPVAVASVATAGLFRMGAMRPEQSPVGQKPPPKSKPRAQSAAPSSIRLAPISVVDIQAVTERRRLQEEEDAVEYELDKPLVESTVAPPRQNSQPPGRFFWGRGGVAEVLLIALRKFSDYAYLISVPFLLLMLLAIILKQRELAVMAGVIVIMLNVVRLGLDGFVLVTLAFKNGPVEGVLFFLPPLTLYYLSKRGQVMQEALKRFLGATLPIIGVLLLAIFVPWLRGGGEEEPSSILNRDRIRNELQDVRESIKTKVDPPQDTTNYRPTSLQNVFATQI